MAFLWTYGAAIQPKRLLAKGEPRGVQVFDSASDSESVRNGSNNSVFVPSVDGKHILVFEWDETTNIKYVIEI